ncbi:DsbA family protein [Ectobacillus ponti]|uniref:DsbA family protein n=1 Tax=Ectobacillus ponti TaxID=2961894 RepID=A0AA41X9T1_9BACI|nr:thioredoxin domain-containing protein [Ectobacillus ponti]MCP8969334.1 DsbA family protein [Ectobacillus ponti]
MKKTGSIIFIVFSLVFLILGGTIAYTIISKKNEPKESPFAYEKQQTLGNKKAPVHVVEFGDFKCAACRTWDTTVFPQLKKDYIDKGTVQLHFINFPFIGKDSDYGAAAGEAVYKQSPEAFWTFYSKMYESQGDEHEAWITEQLVEGIVKGLPGVDFAQFQKDVKSKEIQQKVANDFDIARKQNAQGAPTVYVDGTLSNPDYDSIKQAIIEAQKKK